MKTLTTRWLSAPLLLLILLASVPLAEAYYDPGIQRWINRDPIGERGGGNVHAFVRNNPLFHYDPFGLAPEEDPCKSEYPKYEYVRWRTWANQAVRDGSVSVQDLLDLGVSQEFITALAKHYENVAKCNAMKCKDKRLVKLNECRAAYLRGQRTQPCGNVENYPRE